MRARRADTHQTKALCLDPLCSRCLCRCRCKNSNQARSPDKNVKGPHRKTVNRYIADSPHLKKVSAHGMQEYRTLCLSRVHVKRFLDRTVADLPRHPEKCVRACAHARTHARTHTKNTHDASRVSPPPPVHSAHTHAHMHAAVASRLRHAAARTGSTVGSFQRRRVPTEVWDSQEARNRGDDRQEGHSAEGNWQPDCATHHLCRLCVRGRTPERCAHDHHITQEEAQAGRRRRQRLGVPLPAVGLDDNRALHPLGRACVPPRRCESAPGARLGV